jgi:hypothetical protein
MLWAVVKWILADQTPRCLIFARHRIGCLASAELALDWMRQDSRGADGGALSWAFAWPFRLMKDLFV